MTRLATWADYGVAVALAVCRRLRLPAREQAAPFACEPVYVAETAAGHVIPLRAGRPVWREPVAAARPAPAAQPWYVRPAEVLMLTLSFFLAAHLAGAGFQEARAPQLSIAMVPSVAHPAPARIIKVTPTALASALPAEAAPVEASETVPAPEAAVAPAPAPAPPTSHAAASDAGSSPTARAVPAAPAEQPVPPAPAVAPPAASLPPLTYAQVIAYAIEAGWPAELADDVARVAWCESRFRPDAVGYGAYGLMQVVPLWFEYAGLDFSRWADPVTNLKAALAAFRYSEERSHAPWAAWSCKPEAITIP